MITAATHSALKIPATSSGNGEQNPKTLQADLKGRARLTGWVMNGFM